MLSAAQVAALLGLSARKVYDLAASGEIASYRFGDAIRFEPADVDAYKASCKVVVRPVVVSVPRSTPLRVSLPGDRDDYERSMLRLGITPRHLRHGLKNVAKG